MNKQLLTMTETCEAYNVSLTAVYGAIRSGDLHAIKPFRQWLIDPEDVRQWLTDLDAQRVSRAS